MASGHLRGGLETTISTTAVQLLGANAARKALIVQETGGSNDFTFGEDDSSVADGLGIHVPANTTIILDGEACYTGAVWAIRTASGDAKASASEIV